MRREPRAGGQGCRAGCCPGGGPPWGGDPGSASAARSRGLTRQGSPSTFAQCVPWALAPPYALHPVPMGPDISFRPCTLAAGSSGSKAYTCLLSFSCPPCPAWRMTRCPGSTPRSCIGTYVDTTCRARASVVLFYSHTQIRLNGSSSAACIHSSIHPSIHSFQVF